MVAACIAAGPFPWRGHGASPQQVLELVAVTVQVLVLRVQRALFVQCVLYGNPGALVVVVDSIDIIVIVPLAFPVSARAVATSSPITSIVALVVEGFTARLATWFR